MARSILQFTKECFICGAVAPLHEHHCIHGTSNRKNSERTGLKVWLCAAHHEQVHKDNALDLQIKQYAQRVYEMTHTREEFRQIFGKSYL